MQAAYRSGITRCAPPDMPTRNVSIAKEIVTCSILVGGCLFLIIILIGGLGNNFPRVYQFILVVVTLLSIISALVVSYMAFQRVVRGDDEAALLFPAWDRATERWSSLAYCQRDNAVFDPQNEAVLTDAQLKDLGTSATQQPEQEVIQRQHSAAVQH